MTKTTPDYFFSTEISDDGSGAAYVPNDATVATPIAPIPAVPATAITATPATTIIVAATPATPVPTPRAAPTYLPTPVVDLSGRFTQADYAMATRALMPRGRVWSDDPGGVQGGFGLGAASALENVDAAATGTLSGSVPGALTSMLPEWEAALGLPDACAGNAPTIAQRLDQVRGRFVGAGGQSRQHFINFAAALGFAIQITNYGPFRVGASSAGDPVASDDDSFVWGVTVISTTGTLPVAVLICELNDVKPAESSILLLN